MRFFNSFIFSNFVPSMVRTYTAYVSSKKPFHPPILLEDYIPQFRKFMVFVNLVLFSRLLFIFAKSLSFQSYMFLFEVILLIPIFIIVYKGYINFTSYWDLKKYVLYTTFFVFLYSINLIFFISDFSSINFSNFWVSASFPTSELGYSYYFTTNELVKKSLLFDKSLIGSFIFYVDGISLFFILLTTFLTPICILISWYSINEKINFFLLSLVSLEFFLVNAFVVSNLFYFFIFFEAILFPMFFIIGIWGSRDRKIHAVYQFLLYTLAGSVFLYVAILLLVFSYDSLDYVILKHTSIDLFDQKLIFWLMFISFAFKIPLFPVHIWLPEAHVEAPTFGSVILAGLLLKLGTYGMMRFLIPVLPDAVNYFLPLVLTIVIVGIFYTSFSTTRQLDLKKIIAYSSVGHMGFVILGLFTTHVEGLVGSLYLMIGHGVVSSALFICVGILYDRYHTRNVTDLRSLARFMPLYAIFFLIFTLANVSFPGTFNFIAEVNVLFGLTQINLLAAVVSIFSIIFIMVYAFWLYNRTMYGTTTAVFDKFFIIGKYMDLSVREFIVLFIFAFLTLFFGFFPNYILMFLVPGCELLNITYDSF